MRRARFAVWLMVATGLLTAPADADVLHLLNGRRVEGKVKVLRSTYQVDVGCGRIEFLKSDVSRVEWKATAAEELAARRAALAPLDPEGRRILARWARSRGFDEASAQLEAEARDGDLDLRLAAVGPGDAEGLYAVATWAHELDYAANVVRSILVTVTAVEPDHEPARAALGQVHFRGAWVLEADRDATLFAEESAEMQAAGFVYFDGQWVTPERASALEERAQLTAQRATLRQELRAARQEREQLRAVRDQVVHQIAELAREREELTTLRADLEQKKKELDRALAQARQLQSEPCVRGGIVLPRIPRRRVRRAVPGPRLTTPRPRGTPPLRVRPTPPPRIRGR